MLLSGAPLPDPMPPPDPVVNDGEPAFGILHHAKSRVGSHISATAVGRYAPAAVASEEPTFCEVRRIMPISVPLCLRKAAAEMESAGGELPWKEEKSGWESDAAGLMERSRPIRKP